MALSYQFHIASSSEHARPEAGRHGEIADAVEANSFPAGLLEDIVELKAVEKRYPGLDRVICAIPLGTPLNVQLEDLGRLA